MTEQERERDREVQRRADELMQSRGLSLKEALSQAQRETPRTKRG